VCFVLFLKEKKIFYCVNCFFLLFLFSESEVMDCSWYLVLVVVVLTILVWHE